MTDEEHEIETDPYAEALEAIEREKRKISSLNYELDFRRSILSNLRNNLRRIEAVNCIKDIGPKCLSATMAAHSKRVRDMRHD